ncbi:MAG: mannose-1-phosphate guanylyltransferase [Salibacteraceae bacterium]
MTDVYCVIMAGGIGSRFWPMSRQTKPKQFLDIMGTGSSLIELTYDRLKHFSSKEKFMVVTSDEYVALTQEHLPELQKNQILAEPSRKNTAPCVAYAAYKLFQKNPEAVMVISPADHIILKEKAFQNTLEQAVNHASETGNLVTIGIKPSRPDTGYGYIQFHDENDYDSKSIKKVKTFTEKPNLDLALQFLKSGDFYWNSGMFVWKASAIVEAFNTLMPDLASLFEDRKADLNNEHEAEAITAIYRECPNISIDYGIMEKAQNVDVVLGDFGWSDLGTWVSLYQQMIEKEGENVVLSGDVKTYETSHSIIKLPKEKLAVIQGLTNYIVVDTDDVLLICQKAEEQKIKQFVQDLKDEKRTDKL